MRHVGRVVAALVALDLSLSVVAFAWPELSFTAGAQWFGFACVQALSFTQARGHRASLAFAAVAAIRAADVFTDVVYAVHPGVTMVGW